MPTLLEISGVLSNEELDGENVKTLAVMLPWGISVSQFV